MPSNPSPNSDSDPPPPGLSILHSLDLEEIDPTVFRSVADSLWIPAGARGAFGGQVIGQALNAATKTVGSGAEGKRWGLHSQHVSRKCGKPVWCVLLQ
jgi:acyl-CoA thioesterase 8